MKHIHRLVIASITAATIASACNSSTDSELKTNAQAYLEATANYRLDEARPYATLETQATLDFFKKIMHQTDTNYIRRNQPATIHITAIEHHTDSTATVSYTKRTPIRKLSSTVDMLKRDNEWRAHVVLGASQQ